MEKVDLKKELKHLYRASSREIVQGDVPTFKFLAVDGKGDPNTSTEYKEAVEALFSVSYAAKFKVKNDLRLCDYAVMPLEGLWWADDMSVFMTDDRSNWQWTMMIMQPDFVEDELIYEAIEDVRRKKKLPAIDRLRLEPFTEGRCAQVLHVGPFSEEGPTIERLHAYIQAESELAGKHHEIYLTDIRRAKPENWKTIIRQPMK